MSTLDCPDMLKRARYFEIAERYQDMSVEMKKVMKKCIDEGLEISSIVRNLFSLSFKNLVCSRRSSWRVLFAERQRLEEKHSEDLYIVDDILSTIKKELIEICDEVLQNIAEYPLVDFGKYNKIHNVFFLKMQGDYSRYKAEALGDDAKEAVDAASESYTKAMDLASDLSSTDPIKLGLLLNYSVFNYEILNNCEKACSIAQNAFNAAISELDTLKEDYYKDSTLIMQLLRDNLTLWTSKRDVNSEKQDEAYGEPS